MFGIYLHLIFGLLMETSWFANFARKDRVAGASEAKVAMEEVPRQ